MPKVMVCHAGAEEECPPTFVFESCFSGIDWSVCACAHVRVSGSRDMMECFEWRRAYIDRGKENWGVSFFFCLPCDLSVNVAECSE